MRAFGFFVILFFIQTVLAADGFLTIQTGAFLKLANAKKQYRFLKRALTPEELGYLRIERGKRLYFVRLGRYSSIKETEALLKKIKTLIRDAQLIKSEGAKEIIELYIPEEDVFERTLIKVNEHIQKGELALAKKLLNQALKRFGERDQLYGLYGALYLKLSDYDSALKYFSRAILLNDKRPEYYNGAGYTLLMKHRPQEALLDFEKALRLKPDYADALAGTAYAYLALGMRDEALDVYNRLRKIDSQAAREVFKAILREG